MKNFIYSLLISLLTIPFCAQEDSYSSGKQYVVTRHDGGEYIGEIISFTSTFCCPHLKKSDWRYKNNNLQK